MNIESILKTQDEADRLIEAIQELLEYRATCIHDGSYVTGMHAANIKRKSMDLTRQLAKMRRGD